MTNYVVGFIFDNDHSKILLIRKNRPSWQKGWLNGIGGKVELNENPINAMIRECEEETKLHIVNWNVGPIVICPNCKIHYFYVNTTKLYLYKQTEDEKLDIYHLASLPWNIISPSSWILRLCADPFVINKDTQRFIYSVDESR